MSSTVPAALTGIVAAFKTAAPNATVRKGVVLGNSGHTDVLTVAAGSDMGAGVEVHDTDGGPRVQFENYTVNCLIRSSTGSPAALDVVIDRASALLAAAGDALTADQTLGGAVMRARIGDLSWAFEQTKQGAVVLIAFGVDVEARLYH